MVSGNGYTPANWDQISYSSFNKIISVSQGSNSLTLTYGVSKERKKSVTVKNGIAETRYYVGSLYEEVYIGNEIRQINHIFGGNGAVAVFEKSNITGDKLRYLHKDHQGSVMAYSDEAGHLVQELSYDAWGRRRDPGNWEYYPALTDANAWQPRGFTGHEHLDLFEMVNMDGRMYDPVLGRFMSADPYVQAPDYSQSLNRYAYCLNNPLSLMDPSGYSWFSKNWKSLVSATVGIVVTIASGGLGSIVLAGALGGAAAGLSGALLNGANFGQALKATFTGGVWGAAGSFFALAGGGGGFLERLFKHSFSQAWLEGIRGGNMKHGLMAGMASVAGGEAIMEYAGNASRAVKTALNAVVGGTASELGGGKFTNGAMTGAFTMMFNDLMHQKEDTGAKYFANKKEGYDYMWDNSFEDGNPIREVSGWELEEGGMIVLPFDENTIGVSDNNGLTISKPDAYGRRSVKFDGKWHKISTHVHTHPKMVGPQAHSIGIGSTDLDFQRWFGRPINILYDKGIYSVNGTYNYAIKEWDYKYLGTW